ncbi:FkbM family methyltransferase [Selenomonas sp. AE3005]|uniref:FkbM family methyltransferase n=1 Tax=Selenomonas sp. AE3005 TaxID=1485543 RepID=UPI0006891E48|nr:FkbM family methyltransferase [Selenomonas sp. AE3005]
MRNFIKMLQKMKGSTQEAELAKLIENGDKVGLFTAANDVPALETAIDIVRHLRMQGLQIACICVLDECAELVRLAVDELEIVTVSQLNSKARGIKKILILNSYKVWPEAIYQYFLEQGLSVYMLEDSDRYHIRRKEAWAHITDYFDEYMLLADDESKETYLAVIRERMNGQLTEFRFAPEPQYMLCGYMPDKGDIVIDGGAFDGKTAKDFAAMGARVYAFEMNAVNFAACQKNNTDNNCVFENMGLWSCKRQLNYNVQGAGSHISNVGGECAGVIDIDTYVRENNIPRIDYIKLDVEGAELEVLKGAFLTISQFKPKLAISAYHKPEDLYEIQKYIRSLRCDYQFAFRHYRIDGRDYYLDDNLRKVYRHYDLDYMVPTPWEYVLYAR